MNVFIGWSKELSREIAGALRKWLPNVIQSVDAFVSTEDIDLGTDWNQTLSAELRKADFGILCVTAENLAAPWLIFEAGALSVSTRFHDAATDTWGPPHVAPLLFGVNSSKVASPISHFQSKPFGKRELFQLMVSLNKVCGERGGRQLNETMLEKTFELWYPALEEEITALLENAAPPVAEPPAVSVRAWRQTETPPDTARSGAIPYRPPAPEPFPENNRDGFQNGPEQRDGETDERKNIPAPASGTDSVEFLNILGTLQKNFGFIPDIGRICLEGGQVLSGIGSGEDGAEKEAANFETLLNTTIQYMESESGHSNPRRAERLELLKDLLAAFRRLRRNAAS